MKIHALQNPAEVERYLDFGAEVYQSNPYRVPPDKDYEVALLSGQTPHASHARIQPYWIEEGGLVQAVVTAVYDDAYNDHWNEKAGHLLFFEALPDAREAAVQLHEAACEWLRQCGASFSRHSCLFGWQLPLTIDAYDVTPTVFHTYNPPYYHSFIKSAGFHTEMGLLEFRVEFTEQLRQQYSGMVEAAERNGYRLRSFDFTRLEEETQIWTPIVNQAFSRHWGSPPFQASELEGLTVGLRDHLVPEITGFAEWNGEVVGEVYCLPDLNQAAQGKEVDHGVLLIIGVLEGHRGRGVNLALGARSFLAMMNRGYKSASYTVVLDGNHPSRRTAEKLGCRPARNFVAYRRNLGSRS